MQKELPVRKRNRLQGYDYSSAGYYFLTVCVENGHEMLGEVVGDAVLSVPRVELSDIGKIVRTYLEELNTVLEYAFLENMPNHVHLLIVLNGGTQRTASPTKAVIPRIVHEMKSVVTPTNRIFYLAAKLPRPHSTVIHRTRIGEKSRRWTLRPTAKLHSIHP